MVTVTIQVVDPVTVTVVLYRSPHTVPGTIVAVQVPPPGGGLVGGGVLGGGVLGGGVPSGATARPVVGEIMPGHRLRLLRFAMICGIAAIVFGGKSCMRMIWPA